MKFKQLAIAATLLMASSAPSALMITMSNVAITSSNSSGALHWTTTSVGDFNFNLSSNTTVTYGSFSTDSFPFSAHDLDGLAVSFDLTPPTPGVTVGDSTGKAIAMSFIAMGGSGDGKVFIDFDNAWINMGLYQFKLKDHELASDGNVSLKAEFQIPEPSVLALFGAGLLGLGAVRRRKIKS